MEIVRPLWVTPFNFLSNCLRRVTGVGPRWKMHLYLARRLVAEGSWFMIPLTSGTQSPIFAAIDYLVAKEKKGAAIAQLEKLFDLHVTGERNTVHSERLDVGTVTYCAGPQNYMPLRVQYYTTRALLKLYNGYQEAPQFVAKYLATEYLWRLGEETIRELLSNAIRSNLCVDETILRGAFEHLSKQVVEQETQRLCAV
jgi:hypothetical protein